MERNFPEALAHTLKHEGGWANNLNDPGGATMKGVTHKTYAHYLGRDVSHDELRAISDEHWQIFIANAIGMPVDVMNYPMALILPFSIRRSIPGQPRRRGYCKESSAYLPMAL